MKKLAILVILAFSLVVFPTCGVVQESSGDQSLDEIRERLEQRKCQNRMNELSFRMRQLYLEGAFDLSLPEDSILSLLPDSLLFCPVTEVPYITVFEENCCRISCPVEGHSGNEVQLD